MTTLTDKDRKLKERFPTFFPDGESETPLGDYGIECEEGWHDVLFGLCEQIEAIPPPKDFRFAQIKNKYGLLTIYCDNGTPYIDSLIEAASERAMGLCEFCGSTEDVQATDRWIFYLCATCRETHR